MSGYILPQTTVTLPSLYAGKKSSRKLG